MKKQFRRGEIYWANNTYSNGHIQSSLRPYLIVSNNYNNEYSGTLTAIPLTTADKKFLPTHFNIFVNNKWNTVLCEHITSIDKTETQGFVAQLDDQQMKQVEEKIKIQLDLKGE